MSISLEELLTASHAISMTENSSPAFATAKVPFPKIVALCGANTAVGSKLLNDLLHSDQVDKVYAIATEDVPLLNRLQTPILRKARVTIVNPDKLDSALARIVECDLAFCVMTTDRHASSSVSKATFYAINFSAPMHFLKRMFELGVLHISVLSHHNADLSSRSDFYHLKGELEAFLTKICKDAGDFAPMVSLYKMPSNIMASTGTSSRSRSRSPSRDRKGRGDVDLPAVQVNHVATVMQIDAFEKASSKGPPGTRRRKNHYEVLDSEDVHRVLTESAYHESWLSPV